MAEGEECLTSCDARGKALAKDLERAGAHRAVAPKLATIAEHIPAHRAICACQTDGRRRRLGRRTQLGRYAELALQLVLS